MKPAVAIVKQLRSMEFPESHVRELRALFVAQAIAYQVPLDPKQGADATAEVHEPMFLAVLNGVNEFMPVDTRLARSQFRRLIAGRLKLLHAVDDTALLAALLASDTQYAELSRDTQGLIRTLVSLPAFGAGQEAIQTALCEALAARTED